MRLFVALDLPGEVRASLGGWALQTVGADARLRLVAEDKLHATLVFLGERPDADAAAAAIAAALDPIPAAPQLRTNGALWLSPRRPHVLTVALEDASEGLASIHAAVLEALVRDVGHQAGAHGAEGGGSGRAFRPHITVARVRGRLRPFEVAEPPAVSFHPPAVTLYRSVLGRAPASYESMASVPLSTLP